MPTLRVVSNQHDIPDKQLLAIAARKYEQLQKQEATFRPVWYKGRLTVYEDDAVRYYYAGGFVVLELFCRVLLCWSKLVTL